MSLVVEFEELILQLEAETDCNKFVRVIPIGPI